MKKLLILAYILIMANFAQAQQAADLTEEQIVAHQIIVQLSPGVEPRSLSTPAKKSSFRWSYKEEIIKELNIHLYQASSEKEVELILDQLKGDPRVMEAERNQMVESRCRIPNDEYFFDQYTLDLLNMSDVWCEGTSPVTVDGDTIVLAVVEADNNTFNHADIIENLWVNHGEIPGDGIDNDGNGYVDDLHGIDATTGTGESLGIGNSTHGLKVTGVLGARADNNVFITGVAWNIPVIQVDRATNSASAMKGYEYLYQLRKRYNESNGEEGVYIVAANSSFGNDTLFSTEAPIWCQQYERLASVGIISFGAVRNQNENIDQEGDIPGTCPQDGIVIVGNLSRFDGVESSGFSPTNVDIVTYGSLLTVLDKTLMGRRDTLRIDSGTSFSTPHLTGLVGLLYGQACERFVTLSKIQPEIAVSLMKEWILDKSIPIASQIGRTVTEGKFDPEGVQQSLFQYCEFDPGELSISRVFQNMDRSLSLEYTLPSMDDVIFRVYNPLGQLFLVENVNISLSDPWVTNLNMGRATSGVYYLQIEQSGKTDTRTFFYNPQ